MQKLLKDWRQDAMNKHQYDSAIYIGDKLLALTNDPKDAFWLAQVHFTTGNYTRAQSFLDRHKLVDHSPSCRYLAAHCYIKQSKFEEALGILGEKNPTHLISTSSKARRKLQHTSSNLRTGIAKGGKLGRPDRIERSEEREKEREREDASDLRFEAAMCYLRGLCYAKQNAFDRAKECYKDAVRIDVQCFEAFDQLMKNSLMSPSEEWEFLDALDFDSIPTSDPSISQEASQFVKMLYTTRLSKYKKPDELNNATETLSTHYHLASNPDLLLAKADLLFTQCRFKEALALTSSILEADEYNFAIYPLHLACLHELNQTNTLFLLAHRLADLHPDEPATWLAVGVYYLSIQKIAEARRYFSKASMMDPHFGPAWIGFAHTFAAEGEHDQAISAYSAAARLFQGTHLPQLFLGMQNLLLNNMTIAHEYLNEAFEICPTDPLLLNEMGVVFYHGDHLPHAIKLFQQALAIAASVSSDPKAWVATRANLGHAFRRSARWKEALGEFDEVLRQGGKDAGIFCAKGLCLLEMGRSWEAVVAFHEALGVQAQDPVATDLLGRALEENARMLTLDGGGGGEGGGANGDGEDGGAAGGSSFGSATNGGAGGAPRGMAGGDADEDDIVDEMLERKKAEIRENAATAARNRATVRQNAVASRKVRARRRVNGSSMSVSTPGGGGVGVGGGTRGAGGEDSMMVMSDDEDDE
ncbi:anaphase promoting complex subunit cdc16 [Agyrium rufum]|nr:anaphase promoting complex subunit cdc16 [Agyrium rufum]